MDKFRVSWIYPCTTYELDRHWVYIMIYQLKYAFLNGSVWFLCCGKAKRSNPIPNYVGQKLSDNFTCVEAISEHDQGLKHCQGGQTKKPHAFVLFCLRFLHVKTLRNTYDKSLLWICSIILYTGSQAHPISVAMHLVTHICIHAS